MLEGYAHKLPYNQSELRKRVLQMKNYIKKLALLGIFGFNIFSIVHIKSFCPDGNCPYTEIDCAKCCSAGRFVSDACCRACNCKLWNDDAGAECNDFPH